MKDEVQACVFNALHKGRIMRERQKEYFRTRSADALKASKSAEREFDESLDTAAKAVKLGYVPKQEELL